MGRLTTHVLDTARGAPAEGLAITLSRLEPDGAKAPVPSSMSPAALNPMMGQWLENVAAPFAQLGIGAALKPLLEARTNADGRCDGPLLEGEAFTPGGYELVFHVGAYFAASGVAAAFYDLIPVRFVVTDAAQHFHVPLLLSPYGYSTYRGS